LLKVNSIKKECIMFNSQMCNVVIPIMISGAMPYLLTLAAKAGAFTSTDNHQTRLWQSQLSGWRQRAYWAHLNSFEAFPLFAAAVIVAHLGSPGSFIAASAAWGFVAVRVIYSICFITDKAALRSFVWFVGMACIGALFISALLQ
jgi:uncharacterized MAPEG superfamily protein